jgi:IclR family transcriptional regulator, KDG regulon repressor
LEEIRVQGYAIEKEEAVEGLVGIAAPIKDYSRQVVAALGLALPRGRRTLKEDLAEIVKAVKYTCDSISSELGYLKF